MKPTGRKVTLLIWPTGFPEGNKEPGAPEKPFLFLVPQYDYAEEPEDQEELGFKLSDLYAHMQTGVVERVQVKLSVGAGKTWMWVDEEGLIRRKPINEWATKLYWRARNANQPIVGTVAIEVTPGMLLRWDSRAFGDFKLLETKELT
jgi:hypothetical protein